MSLDGFFPGYLIYLLVIFLPGIGFGELFGAWRTRDTLAERFALAFALGLSIDTIFFLIKTSGFAGLTGITLLDVYVVIVLGIVALFASLMQKRKFTLPVRPRGIDVCLFVIMVLIGLMLIVYFRKYPIFPEYFTQDPTNHVNYVNGLISGSISSIPSGLLYFGVHYQLAAGVLLVGGEPLVVIQRIMAILVTISPLLFYHASKRLFSSGRAALVITILYAFSGMIWFAGVFDSGLYPNFFGILAALFLIVAILNAAENSSVASWLIFLVALTNGYISHYTFLTLLPALIVLPILMLGMKPNPKDMAFRRYLTAAIITIAPAAIPLLFFPKLGSRILFLATSGGGNQAASTFLSNAFASYPVLSFLAVEMENDAALIVSLVLAVVFVYRFLSWRDASFVIPLVWFISLFIAAPYNISAWRFSYEALVPLTIMAGFGLYSLLPVSFREEKKKQQTIRKGTLGVRIKTRGGPSQLLPLAIVIVLLGTLLIGSWGQLMLTDALTNTTDVSQSQNYVYQAIYWLKANTPTGSQYLSVSDWRFTYTNLLIGRLTHYQYLYNVTSAIDVAKNTSSNYILVTNVVTASVPNIPTLYPWNNFPTSSNANLTLLFSNSDVRIYGVS